MKKKITALLLALLMCTASVLPVHAADKVLGDVLNTDIVTYIDGFPIRSYNINWNTYIVVEDLMQYGFGVTWDGDARRLTISRTRTCTPEHYTAAYVPEANNAANGTVAANYYATDVVTLIGDKPIESYNIGGFTCVKIDTVAAEFGMGYVWDGEARTVSLTSPNANVPTVQPGIAVTVPDNISPEQAENYVVNETYKKIAVSKIEESLNKIGALRNPEYAVGFIKQVFGFKEAELVELATVSFANAFNDYSYGIKYAEVNGNTVTTTVEISMRKLDDAFTYAALALMYMTSEKQINPTKEEAPIVLLTFLCLEIADDSREVVTRTVDVNITVDPAAQTAEISDKSSSELLNAILGGLLEDPLFAEFAN